MLPQLTTITQYRTAIQHHLEQGIIPFWLERAPDIGFGGYVTNFDANGQPLGTEEKYLNTQARLVWWFSTLYRHYPSRDEFRKTAELGMEFLLRHFWDERHEGWFWKTHRDGTCLDSGKVVYGQSFAIYALAEYYRATRDGRVLEFATRTFDLLQKWCADTLNGGYFENLERDWSLAPDGFAGGDRKTLDTHMHLLESFTVLSDASGIDLHRRKLLEVLELIRQRMIDPSTGCGGNHFTPAFQPIPAIAIKRTWNAERQGDAPAIPTDTTSFGHNVELAWLMHRALQVAGAEITPYLPTLYRLVDHTVQFGLDKEYGGIFRDGHASGEALIMEKEWWQHAEALVGFLDAHLLSEAPRYWDAFVKVWEFVSAHMINHAVGEWYTLLDRTGAPLVKQLGNEWKVAYHTGRAMLECSQRLQILQERRAGEFSTQQV